MNRHGPVSFAGAGLLGVCLQALLLYPAQAACDRWDIGGTWTAIQNNGPRPKFTLVNTADRGIQGKAEYLRFGVIDPKLIRGSVDGAISGNNFAITVYWDDGSKGMYAAIINPQGRMAGGTRDLNQPTSVGAQWYVERTFRCAPPSPPAPAPNQQAGDKKPPVALGRVKPPVALGRVQPAPTGELSPICAAAQKARANKSPATANLEAQCRAAGGT